MLDKIRKKINTDKEILASFPTNNDKNIKHYTEEVQKKIDIYNSLKSKIYSELYKRIEPYLNLENPNFDKEKAEILKLKEALFLINNLNTPYEKINLDKVVYALSNYSKGNLNEINKLLLKAIDSFKNAGINLSYKDFNYTSFVSDYMFSFFKNIDNLTCEELKDVFDNIYWKNPDIILELELNIRYLYLINKQKIEKNFSKKIKDGDVSKIIESYSHFQSIIQKENEDYNVLINKFKIGILKVDDYQKEKIEKLKSNLSDDYELLNDLLNSLYEYKNYLNYFKLIDKVKGLYNETLEKNFLSNKLKEVMKLERQRKKLSSKKIGVIKKTQIDKNELAINKIVKDIKLKYDEIDNNLFKYVVKEKIKENSTYFKILLLVCQYYKIIMDELEDENELNKLSDFVLNSNNNIINNITLLEDVDITNIIVEKYCLSGVNLTKEMLDENNLDNLISDIKKIIISLNLEKQNITILELENLDKIIKLEEKTM